MTEPPTDPHLEELNPGEATVPRMAASVILLRRGSKHTGGGLEVLLGKRTDAARFMPGVWVFPGGAVDGAEPGDHASRLTALRELEEEVGVRLEKTEDLVPFSRWITPVEVKVRFDTWFYLARAPAHCRPEPDGQEIVDAGWFSPAQALDSHRAGELLLVFPTIKQLEKLAGFGSAEEALREAASREVEPILPKVVTGADGPRVLLPGDPGYPTG
jgi:8-oxo-dGTP pyrophosphatase MutT (NUDIX family)